MPFGIHQAGDYLLAAFLAETGLHLRDMTQAALLAAAAVLTVTALLSRGPLGLLRLLPGRIHHVVDLTVVVALVALPVAVRRGRGLTSTLVAVLVAVALARLSWSTRYRSFDTRLSPARH